MPNLTEVYVMGLPMTFHPQIQQLFNKKLPEVNVILSNDYPGAKAKKQMNSFMHYCKKHRASVKELNPNLERYQITKILGESWGSLADEERLPFSDKIEIDGVAIPDENDN